MGLCRPHLIHGSLSPQPKRHLDRFRRFCTVHCRATRYITMGRPLSLQIVPPNGNLNPHLIHDSMGPSEPTTQTASRSVHPFLHSSPQSVPIIYNGQPLPLPSKLPLPMGGSGRHLIHGSSSPPETITQMASRSVQPFFAGLTTVTDRQTDYATWSVTIGRIYVRRT